MKKILGLTIIIELAICVLIVTGCKSNNDQAVVDDKINVLVSILPLTEFVSEIGGDRVEVEAIIPPGYEPHSYELTPAQLVGITKADLYVKAGHIEFEKSSMAKIVAQNKDMQVIDGSAGVALRNLESHGHENRPESIHELENKTHSDELIQPDPHTWLSITNAKIYGQNITQALSELDPANQEYYQQNLNDYLNKLDSTDSYLQNKLGELENKKIIVYHPAFGYLLDDYGLTQVPVEIDGKEPTAAQLADLITKAKKENIKTIFIQKQFSPKNAETIAVEIGGSVVQIDPLAADFVDNLQNIGNNISENQ